MARPRKHSSVVDDELERFVSVNRQALAVYSDGEPGFLPSKFASLAYALLPGNAYLDSDLLTQLKKLVCRYVAYYQDYLLNRGYPCRTATLYGMVISRLFELLVVAPPSGRKGKSGVYFSGPNLAYFVARQANCELGSDSGMIFDPCMGSGMLLMAYLDLLVKAGVDPLCAVSERLCGLDIDLRLVSLSQLLLAVSSLTTEQLHSPQVVQSAEHNLACIVAAGLLQQGDALHLQEPYGDISVLLLNPPWEGPASLFVRSLIESCQFKCLVFVSPAALWTDLSARALRQIIFAGNWLRRQFTFINLDFALPVHSYQQYAVSVLARGAGTETIAVYSDAGVLTQFDHNAEALTLLSSDFDGTDSTLGGAQQLLLHVASADDLHLLRQLPQMGVSFGSLVASKRERQRGDGSAFLLGREFDMSLDRAHFVPHSKRDLQRHLPLIEGRMLEQFGYQAKSYVTGSGRSARWQCDGKGEAQFYIDREHFGREYIHDFPYKIGFQSVGSSINQRSMIAAVMPDLPCGNSVSVLRLLPGCRTNDIALLHLMTAVLNSFVFDYQVRARLHGNNINYFLLQDCILPQILQTVAHDQALDAEQALLFALVVELAQKHGQVQERHTRSVLEALIARLYGLSLAQYSLIVGDARDLSDNNCGSNSRGFWRVDKGLETALRLPLMSWNQFKSLQEMGVQSYVDYIRSARHSAFDLTSV